MEVRPEMNALLEAAQGGSADALGKALEACRAYLLLIANQEIDPKLRAKGGASDIVQETFVDAQRAFPRFSSVREAEFLAWLRTLLLNNLSDFRRRYQGTEMRSVNLEFSIDEGSSSIDWRKNLVAEVGTPSGEFLQQETFRELERAVRDLPEDYRRIILLRYVEELSFPEIAQAMDRSVNAVQKLFARAILKLQEVMETPP